MTAEDRLWIARIDALLRPLYVAWVQPPGARIRMPQLRVYVALLRAHRWLWVLGFKL